MYDYKCRMRTKERMETRVEKTGNTEDGVNSKGARM